MKVEQGRVIGAIVPLSEAELFVVMGALEFMYDKFVEAEDSARAAYYEALWKKFDRCGAKELERVQESTG